MPFNPAHPGEILKELVIEPLGLTLTEFSQKLGISRKTISKIVNCRGSITSEMAIRLEKCLTNPPADHWLRLQNAYDIWQDRQRESEFKVEQVLNHRPSTSTVG